MSCCQKGKNAVLKKSESLAQTISLDEVAEKQRSSMFGLTGQTAGLGCFFLLLAAIFRRRSSTPVAG